MDVANPFCVASAQSVGGDRLLTEWHATLNSVAHYGMSGIERQHSGSGFPST